MNKKKKPLEAHLHPPLTFQECEGECACECVCIVLRACVRACVCLCVRAPWPLVTRQEAAAREQRVEAAAAAHLAVAAAQLCASLWRGPSVRAPAAPPATSSAKSKHRKQAKHARRKKK